MKDNYTVKVDGLPVVQDVTLFTAMTTAFEAFDKGFEDVEVEGMLGKLEEIRFYSEGRE